MKPGQPFADSVVNHWLITATDGRNCRGEQCRLLAIGPLSSQHGNCQGMLDSSRREGDDMASDHFPGVKKMVTYTKRWASDRIATRCVANSIETAHEVTTEKSLAVRAGGIALS